MRQIRVRHLAQIVLQVSMKYVKVRHDFVVRILPIFTRRYELHKAMRGRYL